MRTTLCLLVCATALTVPPPAGAVLTLEFWKGEQNFTPYNPVIPTQYNPRTLQGLRNWNFTDQSKLTSLSVAPNSQFILKVVLRDSDPVGDGSGYTLSGSPQFENAYGLATFTFNFGYTPGVLWGTRDAGHDGKSPTVTAWGGTNLPASSTRETYYYDYGNSYFGVRTLYDEPTHQSGVPPFQQTNGDVLYPLANFLLTAGANGGTGNLTLSKPANNNGSFASLYQLPNGTYVGVDYDTAVWGAYGIPVNPPQLSFTVVPEPSGMALAGVFVSGIACRRVLRRRVRP